MPPPNPTRADQAFTERVGAAWVRLQDQTDALTDPLGRAAIAKLPLAAGARVVDVGCGCGQTLLELADLVGSSGRVVGVDVSEPMLARARELVAAHPEVELVLANAQTHAFPPATFDAVYSRFGVMFFQDTRAAFANLRAALRPGGHLAFVCWQERARNAWAEVPLQAVMRHLPPEALPDLLVPGRPGPFYLSDPGFIREILTGAGFAGVEVESLEQPVHLGGAMTLGEAVDYCRQIGPAARATVDAPEALRPTLDAALESALAPFVTARGVWTDAAAWVVSAQAA